MTPQEQAAALTRIADEMKTAKPGTRRWKQLQETLDQLCGTEEKPRDKAAEAAWERSKQR